MLEQQDVGRDGTGYPRHGWYPRTVAGGGIGGLCRARLRGGDDPRDLQSRRRQRGRGALPLRRQAQALRGDLRHAVRDAARAPHGLPAGGRAGGRTASGLHPRAVRGDLLRRRRRQPPGAAQHHLPLRNGPPERGAGPHRNRAPGAPTPASSTASSASSWAARRAIRAPSTVPRALSDRSCTTTTPGPSSRACTPSARRCRSGSTRWWSMCGFLRSAEYRG